MGIMDRKKETSTIGYIGCRIVFVLRARHEQAHLGLPHTRIGIQRYVARQLIA